MCHPYIESAFALSDYYIDDEEKQEFPVFVGHQKLTSAMKLKARKAMVDFKFDALYS